MKRTIPTALIAVSATALALSGCSSSADSAETDGVSIVASTNVYGDIAAAIAGDAADVTSIIDSSVQDPHSYEASAQDRLAVSKADIVIQNGGGYDGFIDSLLGDADPIVLNASEISGLMPEAEGHEHEHEGEHDEDGAHGHEGHNHIEGFNEHVWYSLDAMNHVAEHLAEELSELDPDNASTFEDNYDEFSAELESAHESLHELGESATGASVLITEPVPLYLLEDAGLVNETPAEFSEAVEEGTDVPAAVIQEMLELVQSGDIAMLAYNEQTSGPITEEVKDAAESAGVPVVSFSETLPDGEGYVSWMTANIEALSEVFTA
ncbi:metal ABC transporter solute-binding protein, Zn/Mn family [Paramicrobacterium agarici]|uniref:Zinc/manganese transport system substrate-binding protein n=1 Tax=Paramicrobacterium agarici TaxID=630514 RepID=A0A2A9DU54_9MICO|nr:zinc ABC transporter substrate-binding protein [Microbacterium agarici]PFG30228.1 zinc/manganese transport system substrate-binding protein [Microbacterium agarici]TQO23236.1 zinc/manganese transport system substrate-binding protein [Microbacterium agarici]